MFLGNYLATLDDKGRLAVPRKYRRWLRPESSESKPEVVMTKNPNAHCLVVYPMTEWQIEANKVRRHPGLEPGAGEEEVKKAEELEREFFGKADPCTIDSQGRVLVPPDLRREADLTRQVRVVGRNGKFELWDETTWNRRSAAGRERVGESADRAAP